jgi:parallel beta-helix repeat protein
LIGFFVSPGGDDAADGTQAHPFRTIQHGLAQAKAGQTVTVAAGTYTERITFPTSGTDAAFITLQAATGAVPVLDGTGMVPTLGWFPMVDMGSASFVRIRGFEIRNLRGIRQGASPVGILVSGSGQHVEILECHVHHIEANFDDGSVPVQGADAHGIAVYGTGSTDATAIHDLLVDGCEVDHCKLGSSESVVINGNVRNFSVTNNVIHDNNNIGIDLIGYEGTSPVEAVDRARQGLVAGNLVYNIDTNGNPAYRNSTGGFDASADGIYVDGGTNSVVERNTVHHCDIGIELASEQAGKLADAIILRSNLVHDSLVAGLAMGGYDVGLGTTRDCQILNNTFWNNDTLGTGSGELMFQYNVLNNLFENNIIVVNAQELFVTNAYTTSSGNTFDHNLWSASDATSLAWYYNDSLYSTFAEWQAAVAGEANSGFGDPLFVGTATGDFHLQLGSPAVDAGANLTPAQVGTQDLGGGARIKNAVIDLGAFER